MSTDSTGYGAFPQKSQKVAPNKSKNGKPQKRIPTTGVALAMLALLGLVGYGLHSSYREKQNAAPSVTVVQTTTHTVQPAPQSTPLPAVLKSTAKGRMTVRDITPVVVETPPAPKIVVAPQIAVAPLEERIVPIPQPTPVVTKSVNTVVIERPLPVAVAKAEETEKLLGGTGKGGSEQYQSDTLASAQRPKGMPDSPPHTETAVALPREAVPPTGLDVRPIPPAEITEEIVEETEADGESEAPMITRGDEPVLARHFRNNIFKRSVEATFNIRPNGRFSVICESTGDRDVDAAVLKALKKWRFEPAKEKGEKVESILEVTIHISVA